QLGLELGDAVADLAAIELHGGLPRAPQPDAAALALAAAGRAQPRGYIGEPRDLDLQPRRSARRVPMEDLDDHTRAIQDLRGRGRALDVAELARRQLVVDDDDGGTRLPGRRRRRRDVQWFGLVLLFLCVFFGRFLLAGRTLGDDACAAGPGGQLHQLALAEQRGGAEAPLRFCVTSPTTSKPSVSHRRLSSLSEDRCSASVTRESWTPTRTALGRGASVGADMMLLRGFQVDPLDPQLVSV